MRLDKLEQAAARHAENGFCRVIGCPECEVRRQERFGGKTLEKVRVEVVEGGVLDFDHAALQREHVLLLAENRRLVVENTGLMESLAASRAQVASLELNLRGYDADCLGMEQIIEGLRAQLAESAESIVEMTQLVIAANDRAQALGAETCGFVAAMLDLAEAPAVSPEMEQFLDVLAGMALAKLHDASHRLAPVQHD